MNKRTPSSAALRTKAPEAARTLRASLRSLSPKLISAHPGVSRRPSGRQFRGINMSPIYHRMPAASTFRLRWCCCSVILSGC